MNARRQHSRSVVLTTRPPGHRCVTWYCTDVGFPGFLFQGTESFQPKDQYRFTRHSQLRITLHKLISNIPMGKPVPEYENLTFSFIFWVCFSPVFSIIWGIYIYIYMAAHPHPNYREVSAPGRVQFGIPKMYRYKP